MTEMHWEHGWRAHGLYAGEQQVGTIGLTPPGYKPVGYCCRVHDRADHRIGETTSLRAAKRLVERYVKAHHLIPGDQEK
jgi:hypothetical protein